MIGTLETGTVHIIFDVFQKLQIDRGSLISQLLQFEQKTGVRIEFIDVNGYPVHKRVKKNDLVEYNLRVVDTAQSFILLPRHLTTEGMKP